ncbi:hypothetical protein K8M07_12160 [Schnuerera sp. xch1]|uniref:PTS sugar transporter subunit IIA n=1 Tax=Schnuerera sp. xch1 TaxID=2874283 RepID=UPI001CBD4F5A|nr:hypothetical protein [Schnuerera sp. xch1]MBZ2175993.1 hypothetical protein [Schnuerera sp. xch1]
MSETKILLLTHGGWGMSLVRGVEMILGKIDFVKEVPLLPNDTLLDYKKKVIAISEKMSEDSLILTDVLGGTTTNVAAVVGRQRGIKVICGLNAPLLITASSSIIFSNKLDFEHLLNEGKVSIKDVIEEANKLLMEKDG